VASDQEIQTILLQVKGKAELDQLNKTLEEEVLHLQKLNQRLADGKILPEQYAQASLGMGRTIADLNNQVKALEGSLGGLEEKGGGFKLRGGMRADLILTHAFRELSSETATAAEKLERMGMVMPYVLGMMGVDSKWMLGLTLGTTAIIELYTHWNELLAVLGNSAPLEAAQHLAALKKQAEEAAEAFTKMVEAPAGHEEIDIKRTKGLLEGSKGRIAQDALAEAMARMGTGEQMTGPELREMEMAERVKRGEFKDSGGWEARANENRERIRKANIVRAQALLGAITSGKTRAERDAARMEVAGLAQAQAGLFPPEFSQAIEQPPATREEQQALEVQGRENRKRMAKELEDDRREATALERKNRHDERANLVKGEAEAEKQAQKDADLAQKFDDENLPKVGSAARARAKAAREQREQLRQQLGEGIARASEQLYQNTGGMQGGTPSADQLHGMVDSAVRNMSSGMNAEQAKYAALVQKVRAMEKATADYNAMQSQLGMGTDQSGAFSFINPNWGG
jgi:hypothetical protein